MMKELQNNIIKKLNNLYSAQAQNRNRQDHLSQTTDLPNFNGTLSLRQLEALSLIDSDPQCGVSTLSNIFAISKPAVSRLVSKLETNGLITSSSAQDKRRKTFLLTSRGKILAEKHNKLHNQALKGYLDVLNGFDDNELLVIDKFIDALNQHIFQESIEE